ncbi:helix-turn-helix domain-containing protein [Peribacillus sp. NPDC060186]
MGMPLSHAKKYEVDVKTIRKRRDKLNLPKDRRSIARKTIDEEEFTKDYLNGLPWDELCEKYKISEATGNKIRKKLALPARNLLFKKPSSNSYNKQDFLNDCMSGMTVEKLAEKYKVSNGTIYKRKKEIGYKFNKTSSRQLEIINTKFIEDYRNGLSWKELCDIHRFSKRTGQLLRDQFGLPKRRK